ncbi:MAG: SPOR domain-containing protein, partial [Desulfobacterota bacterium]|nr:SPOR domain-containing protein [Thermodesulfobacteriota bacterium]
ESFRGLRTNIQFKDGAKEIKTIAVTSASPQEGKTIVSINLAITMAQAGLKTLLIGSDMRKPMIARIFGVEQAPGLSEILLGNCPWRDAVQTVTSMMVGKMSLDEVLLTPGLDNLHLIAAGSIPPNPAELVESKRLKEFIEEAESDYDLILFDSPPILSTADAAILSSKMDGVLLVYRVGAVSRGLLKRSTAQLEQVKCRILGVILNGLKPEVSPDFHNFKYYKYYASYGEEGKKENQPNKGFPFFRESGVASWGKAGKGSKGRRSVRTLSLAGVGLILIAAGILWHLGILDPSKAQESAKAGRDKTVQPAALKAPPRPPPAPAPPVKQESAKTVETQAPVAQAKQEPVQEFRVQAATEKPQQETLPSAPPLPPAVEKNTAPLAKAKETAPVFQGGEYPYSIYLSSLKTQDQAKRAISVYAGKGIQAYWVKVHFKEKGEWYRIYAGHFKDRQEAEAFAQARGISDKEILKTEYANFIGAYARPGDLDARAKAISGLGYSSYTVTGSDGKLKLLVGAYVTEEAAQQQRQDLMAKGIENQVIRR